MNTTAAAEQYSLTTKLTIAVKPMLTELYEAERQAENGIDTNCRTLARDSFV